MSDSMHDTMHILSMFPDEPADARIFWNCFWLAVLVGIRRGWSFDRKIIDENVGDVGNFLLKDEGHACLEFGGRVGESSWKGCDPQQSERSEECCHVSAFGMDFSCIESPVQVKYCVALSPSKGFQEIVQIRWKSSVFDRDGIEWLEVMDDP